MATSPRIAFTAVRTLNGMGIPRQEFKEAASTTFKAGAPLVVASGYANECGADPALVLGIATKDGQGGSAAGDKSQPVIMAYPGTVFLGNLSNAADNAVTAQTDIMTGYGILKHSGTGKWFVDKGETSNKRVQVWDFWLQDKEVIGDVRGRILFTFDPDICQGVQS